MERIKTLAKEGNALLDQNQFPQAETVYAELLRLCEAQMDGVSADEASRFWCLACTGMGTIRSFAGDQEAAREWYGKAVPVCQRLAAGFRSAQAGRELSLTYGNLGDTYAAQRDFHNARIWYEKKWEIVQQYLERFETEITRYDLVMACCKLGYVSRGEEQLGWYRKALEVLARLTDQHPDNARYVQLEKQCRATVQMLEKGQ